jgi:hypothetical protein
MWTGMEKVMLRIARMVRRWVPLLKPEAGKLVEEFAHQLENRASLPPQLTWMPDQDNSSSGLALSGVQRLDSVVWGRHDEPCNGVTTEPCLSF